MREETQPELPPSLPLKRAFRPKLAYGRATHARGMRAPERTICLGIPDELARQIHLRDKIIVSTGTQAEGEADMAGAKVSAGISTNSGAISFPQRSSGIRHLASCL